VQEEMQARLEELKAELEKGEAELQRVEAHRTYLHETLLRIGGAIQALEELLSKEKARAEAVEPNGVVGGEESLSAAQEEKAGA
jgi:predicted nuclease with TOPRIM domain